MADRHYGRALVPRCRGLPRRWCATALGWDIVVEHDDEVVVTAAHMLQRPANERRPGLIFVPVQEGEQMKNRIHIDVAPALGDDQRAEVERLLKLG
ncbi:MAG: VOC family protein [Acidimicrobiales bacterium]